MKNFTTETLNQIAQAIYDKKGFNILALDVRKTSTITDFYILAEGHVDRHVASLKQAIVHAMRDKGIEPSHVEGEKQGDWIVLDYLHCIIHLFTPQMRDKYRLEELWRASTIVELDLNLSQQEAGYI